MDRGGYNRGGDGGGRGRGRGRGRDGGRGGGDQQYGRGSGGGGGRRGGYQTEGSGRGYGGDGRGRGRGPPQGSTSTAPVAPAPAWGNPAQPAWGNPVQPPAEVTQAAGSVKPWGPPQQQQRSAQQQQPIQSETAAVKSFVASPIPDIQSLSISASRPEAVQESSKDKLLPIRRPDKGGKIFVYETKLLANHFQVRFNPEKIILHYDVDIKSDMPQKGKFAKPVPKSDLRMIREELFTKDPERFPMGMTVYDGEKNIFSAVELPVGEFKVKLSDGEEGSGRSYTFNIQLVNKLKYGKLNEYLRGEVLHNPRDLIQGMDLVMKENPARTRICLGRSSYSKDFRRGDDLHFGIAAFRGFQQSLKPTSQGLALCLDYTVLAFRKRLPVLDFLREHIPGFSINNMQKFSRDISQALVGLKVTVNHRLTKQRYTISGITKDKTRNLTFDLEDREGNEPVKKVNLVDYFLEKHGKQIQYLDIPCLDVGKNKRQNYLPMEFCTLVDGQRFPKEDLDRNAGILLKDMSLAKPRARMAEIQDALKAPDGPCGGGIIQNFDIQVRQAMTNVVGRVIGAPDLKSGGRQGGIIKPDKAKCQWNLVNKMVVDGKPLDRWALIDFTDAERNPRNRLDIDNFIPALMDRCRKLGMPMAEPLAVEFCGMNEFNSVKSVENILKHIIAKAQEQVKEKLQIIVCVMAAKHDGYKYLKFVSETQLGVLTQCCLVANANKLNDQTLANIGLKINAKLGGSNMELNEPLFRGSEHVMFVGADVNHPSPMNKECPSIAAVVATMNFPAANCYAARATPQTHHEERILTFGLMVLDLVNNYEIVNEVKPKRIVIFRDGVSDGQFDMVLNEELPDIKRAVFNNNYRPTITLVVAQKRHQTRLFPENEREGGPTGNVPPGTVVDTTIIHPSEFDFYLCSHFGGIGTSKPTHYYVLYDEHRFTSDQLQKLIYNMCYTFARCTKPVSLVPPVYYADLVAYRGRLFQEAIMSMGSPPPSVASGSSSTSFDDKFYQLHPQLQNVMFFV